MRLKPPRLYSYSFFTLLIIISSTCQSLRIVNILDLTSKFIPYRRALDWQHSLVEQHISFKEHPKQEVYGSLLVLQHNPVYTLGTGTISNSGPFRNLCSDGKELLYETVRVDRAGEATFHGPGQIVLYPILDLSYFDKDINYYLRNLEETVIRTAKEFGINAGRVEQPGYTGVWVQAGPRNSKVAAIGVKIRRWVTMHGVSVNVDPDMRYFGNIIPCGITDVDKGVGALRQFNSAVTLPVVAEVLVQKFLEVFGVQEGIRLSGMDAEAYLDGLGNGDHR